MRERSEKQERGRGEGGRERKNEGLVSDTAYFVLKMELIYFSKRHADLSHWTFYSLIPHD